MIPDHLVGMNSTATPMSSASLLATSISNPTRLPVLSFIAQGLKVDMPTRSTPLLSTVSSVLLLMITCLGLFSQPPSTRTTTATTMSPRTIPFRHLLIYIPFRKSISAMCPLQAAGYHLNEFRSIFPTYDYHEKWPYYSNK